MLFSGAASADRTRLPRARATLPLSPPSAFVSCAFSGLGTFSAVADCLPDPREGSRLRRALHVLLRKSQGRARAVATVHTLRDPRRHVWKGECVQRLHNPSPVAPG